jgi:hypothetical protein
MQAHGLCGAAGQDESGTLALIRADRAEDVGRLCSLVARRRGAGAAFGPAAADRVLLADPRLVAKPDLSGLAAGRTLRDRRQTRGEVFLKTAAARSSLA